MSMETRHFIGLTKDGSRFSIDLGPGDPDDLPPNEPLKYEGERCMYPVSKEIAEEWSNGEGT